MTSFNHSGCWKPPHSLPPRPRGAFNPTSAGPLLTRVRQQEGSGAGRAAASSSRSACSSAGRVGRKGARTEAAVTAPWARGWRSRRTRRQSSVGEGALELWLEGQVGFGGDKVSESEMFVPRDPPEDGARAAQHAAWEVAWHSGLRPRQSRLRAVPTPSLSVSSAAPAPSPAPSACGALPPGARARLSPVPAPRLLRVPPAFPAPVPGRCPLLAVLRWARLAASFRAASAPSPHPPPPRSRERAHRQASRPDAWSGQGGQPDRGRRGTGE